MIIAKITERGATPGNILKGRRLNDLNREVVREMGEYWHANFREKHFTRAGASEYGYKPRTRGYMIRKAREKGHQDPLVFTGLTRELSRIKHIVPTARGGEAKVRVILHTPALNFIPKGGSINMRDEMTRVSQNEIDKLADVAGDEMQSQLSRMTDTTTKTIG